MPLTPDDFRRLALALPGAVEGAHMGHPDFRVGGKVFASLIHRGDWMGMVRLAPPDQHALLRVEPDVYVPANGSWGRQGCTMVRLSLASSASVRAALSSAWSHVGAKTAVSNSSRARAKSPKPRRRR